MHRNGRAQITPYDCSGGPLTFLDFFAGVGLVEIALEPPWKCVWANDIDPRKKAIYDTNFPENERYKLADVSTLYIEDLPRDVDMAWASFPCQDLSLAGWRRGLNAKRSGVFWSFHRLMHQLKIAGDMPKIIVIENVTGLLYGQNFIGLCEALRDLDLNFGALVIDAKHFVPQSRPRVFFVAVDRRINTEALERSESSGGPWSPAALRNAVDSLPQHLQDRWKWWRVGAHTRIEDDLTSIVEANPSGVEWHTREHTLRLLEMMSATNLAKIEKAMTAPTPSIGFLYRRTRDGQQRAEVRFDGLAGCLRTPNGGSSRQTVVFVENDAIRSRLLSSREAARLMGAPDSFKLPDRYNDAYKAMGDGVAVPVVKWLSEQLLVPLAISARVKFASRCNEAFSDDSLNAWDPVDLQIGMVTR